MTSVFASSHRLRTLFISQQTSKFYRRPKVERLSYFVDRRIYRHELAEPSQELHLLVPAVAVHVALAPR